MKGVSLYVGVAVSLLGMSGCAELNQWAKTQGAFESQDDFTYGLPVPVSSTTPASAADVQIAVEELQVYLKDQEARIGGLLQMRAEVEGQIQDLREQVFVPLRERVEIFEGRLQTQEAQVTTLATRLEASVAPLATVVTAQGGRLDQHDEEMVLLIESANLDKDAMRTTLHNFRDSLVGFHSIMNNLETLVYDEEFRATNAEARLTGLLTEETTQRKQLWAVSGEQGSTMAGLHEQIKGLATLESRVVALHTYVNQVRRGMMEQFDSFQSHPVSQRSGPSGLQAQPRVPSPSRVSETGRVSPSVVPEVRALIAPLPESPTNGALPVNGASLTETPVVDQPDRQTRQARQ